MPLKMDCRRYYRLAGERGNKQQYIDGQGPTGEELVGKPPSRTLTRLCEP